MNHPPSPCVFIADDDEDDCYLLARAFSEHSPECRLQFASNGEVLLETLAQSKAMPSLILLDLNMPRLDGFEALQWLRKNPLYQATPVVILTTSEAQEDQQRARELGANEFITKPLDARALGETVTQLRRTWLLDRCC
ncbi:response regulator [Spirosoma endophyticum]|uniref:Response regulator receiver domain-containing protein n=1 Tax=Spirosoma endophyticum TaxID=662367 RepID=A0A1I2IEW3_9BACT|nr:response regulator [Spirosoma endophyticum]SFF39627.1 Response regulator receiver domain-containing protein [Spirosoma endophyticum]